METLPGLSNRPSVAVRSLQIGRLASQALSPNGEVLLACRKKTTEADLRSIGASPARCSLARKHVIRLSAKT